VAARELGWSADQTRAELADLLEVGWRERRPVLDGWQLAEEELLRAVHRGLGGL
jgi:glycerol-3-phosphate dehydrogenase